MSFLVSNRATENAVWELKESGRGTSDMPLIFPDPDYAARLLSSSPMQHTLLSRVFCPNLFCRLACNGGLWQLILKRSTWLHQGSSIIDHQRHGGRVIEFPRPSRKVYLFIFTQITVSSFRNNHSRRHGCREEDFRRRRIYSRIQVFSRNISNGASFSYMYSN